MPEVSPNTLLMAVQAVDAAIQALEMRLREADDDVLADTEMLMAYARAADDLRDAYEVARLTATNLPPYHQLVPPAPPALPEPT
jgi:hypothetical protein